MKQEYIFKKAGIKDIDKLCLVFSKNLKEFFPEYSKNIKKFILIKAFAKPFLKQQIKSRQGIICLAYSNKEIIGFLIAQYIIGGVCLAVWLMVSKEHQGKGIATELLNLFENEAKKAGVHNIQLQVNERNVEFYKSKGFIIAGKIEKDYYGVDDFLLYKIIQEPKESNFLKQVKL